MPILNRMIQRLRERVSLTRQNWQVKELLMKSCTVVMKTLLRLSHTGCRRLLASGWESTDCAC